MPKAARETKDAKERAEELAAKQRKVEELLREMATRYQKEESGN